MLMLMLMLMLILSNDNPFRIFSYEKSNQCMNQVLIHTTTTQWQNKDINLYYFGSIIFH